MMIPTKNILNKLSAAAKQVDLDVNLKEFYTRKPATPIQPSRKIVSTVTPTRSTVSSRIPVSPKLVSLANRPLTPPVRTPRATSPTVASLARHSDGSARLHARIRELEKQNSQLESTVLYHLRTMETTQRESEALHHFVRQLKTLLAASDREIRVSDVVADLSALLLDGGCTELAASLNRKFVPLSPTTTTTTTTTTLDRPSTPSIRALPPSRAVEAEMPRTQPPRPTKADRSVSSDTREERLHEIMDLIMNRKQL